MATAVIDQHQVLTEEEDADIKAIESRKVRGGFYILIARVLTVAAFLGFWQLASGPLLPKYAISNPQAVSVEWYHTITSAAGWSNIKTTSWEIFLGFILGIFIGTLMGLILGSLPVAGRVLEPLVAAVNGIPKIALAPVFLLFFGIGDWSKIAIAITSVSFIMFYNVYLGMRTVRVELVEILKVMGGKPRHILQYVTAPSLISPFFAGMKAGGPLAILGVIAGEFIASFNGIGHILFVDANDLDSAGVFAELVILVMMSLLINAFLSKLDSIALQRLGLGPRGAKLRGR